MQLSRTVLSIALATAAVAALAACRKRDPDWPPPRYGGGPEATPTAGPGPGPVVSAGPPHLCKFDNYADCKAQCDANKHPGSCRELAFMYQKGLYGAPLNTALAMQLYLQSCGAGFAGACTDVGFLHSEGIGVPKNNAEGIKWYRKGCDEGDGMGCFNLAVMYEAGKGTATDNTMATAYHERACNMGSREGCSSAGYNYYVGRGVSAPDKFKGLKLLRKGCAAGNKWGCDRLDDLGEAH